MKKKTRETRNLTIFIILRFLVILTAVMQVLNRNWDNVFGCVLVLILFTLPRLAEKKLKIDLPDMLEGTIYAFIFAAQILGEMNNFYGRIPVWDTLLHTLNGFIFAGVGFALVELFNKSKKAKVFLSPIYVTIVALSFSITIGTLWEFFEYGVDVSMKQDMQKDDLLPELISIYINEDGENIPVILEDITKTEISYGDDQTYVIENGYLDVGLKDTMKDMIVNAVGAIIFSVFGYFYVKGHDTYEFTKNFMPKKVK